MLRKKFHIHNQLPQLYTISNYRGLTNFLRKINVKLTLISTGKKWTYLKWRGSTSDSDLGVSIHRVCRTPRCIQRGHVRARLRSRERAGFQRIL